MTWVDEFLALTDEQLIKKLLRLQDRLIEISKAPDDERLREEFLAVGEADKGRPMNEPPKNTCLTLPVQSYWSWYAIFNAARSKGPGPTARPRREASAWTRPKKEHDEFEELWNSNFDAMGAREDWKTLMASTHELLIFHCSMARGKKVCVDHPLYSLTVTAGNDFRAGIARAWDRAVGTHNHKPVSVYWYLEYSVANPMDEYTGWSGTGAAYALFRDYGKKRGSKAAAERLVLAEMRDQELDLVDVGDIEAKLTSKSAKDKFRQGLVETIVVVGRDKRNTIVQMRAGKDDDAKDLQRIKGAKIVSLEAYDRGFFRSLGRLLGARLAP